MVQRFQNLEDDYLFWLNENPEGFVMNHFGSNDPAYNRIHKASCYTLHRRTDEGVRTRYEKICSNILDELVGKANEIKGLHGWGFCKKCSPEVKED